VIKITNLADSEIWLNPAYIVSISSLRGTTTIAVQSGDRIQLYEIKETVEQIVEAVKLK